MARQVQRLDRYGRPLPDDEDIIPDGGRVRVALPFMDHLSAEMRRALSLADGGVASRVFRTFVQATASVCMTCG